jgi:hypothetical protein
VLGQPLLNTGDNLQLCLALGELLL